MLWIPHSSILSSCLQVAVPSVLKWHERLINRHPVRYPESLHVQEAPKSRSNAARQQGSMPRQRRRQLPTPPRARTRKRCQSRASCTIPKRQKPTGYKTQSHCNLGKWQTNTKHIKTQHTGQETPNNKTTNSTKGGHPRSAHREGELEMPVTQLDLEDQKVSQNVRYEAFNTILRNANKFHNSNSISLV